MALVVLSGLPCSGKSTAAAELAALVEELSGGEGEAPLRAVVVADVASYVHSELESELYFRLLERAIWLLKINYKSVR